MEASHPSTHLWLVCVVIGLFSQKWRPTIKTPPTRILVMTTTRLCLSSHLTWSLQGSMILYPRSEPAVKQLCKQGRTTCRCTCTYKITCNIFINCHAFYCFITIAKILPYTNQLAITLFTVRCEKVEYRADWSERSEHLRE